MADLELPEEEQEFKPAERRMAEQLVASMTGDFTPEAYRDEYRGALMKVIEAKVAGQTPERPQRVAATKLTDLMEALEASVAAARESRKTAKTAKADGETPAAAAAKNGRRRSERPREVAARKTA